MFNSRVLILCFLGILIWMVNFYFHPDYASSPDASLYAGTARNIIQGHGVFEPGTIPFFLGYLIPSVPFGWPPYHGPFFSLVAAIFFLFFGAHKFSLILANGFFFILTIPFVYLLAKKIYNSGVALLASVWYIFIPSLLDYSISGMSESLFTFLVVFIFFLLIAGKNHTFWAGIVLGLAYLTRPQGILLLFPCLIYLYKTKKNLLPLLFFLGGLAAILVFKKIFLPPFAQDYGNFKNHELWETIAFDTIISTDHFARNLIPTTIQAVFSNLNYVLLKIMANSYYFFQKLFSLTLSPIVILAILSFIETSSNKKIKYLKLLILGSFLTFLVFQLTTIFDFRYLHPFLPLFVILACGTFLNFLKKFNPKRAIPMTALFTFLFIIVPSFTSPGWGTSIQRALASPRKPVIDSILGQVVKENVPKNSVIVSNDFAHLAWYGELRGIDLPLSLANLDRIDKEIVPISAIFLSTHEFKTPLEPQWQDLVDNPHDFGDFYFAKSFEIKPEDNYYRIPVKAVLYLKRVVKT